MLNMNFTYNDTEFYLTTTSQCSLCGHIETVKHEGHTEDDLPLTILCTKCKSLYNVDNDNN